MLLNRSPSPMTPKGELEAAPLGCGQQMTAVDGDLTSELVRMSDQVTSESSPSDASRCYCCATVGDSITCCNYSGCCACCATGEC